MLSINGLTRRFGSTTAVDGVTLDIPAGQMVGMIGSSGAGKSTLLRLINRLVEPCAGSIAYDGIDIRALKGRALREWRARCAMVFQQFNLVGRLDVLTNVMIGRLSFNATPRNLALLFSRADRAAALAALDRLDMLAQAGQAVETLSGGQQQRVSIARALAQQPEIILADEPISSLDPRSARLVMDSLRSINEEFGITIICNLHTLDTACHYSDRILAMSQGKIVFDGAPSSLTANITSTIYGRNDPSENPDSRMVLASQA